MANPRVRFDENGEPKVCVVKVPLHLSKILYKAALRARQGLGGVQVEESDIVVGLIEEWAKTQDPVDDWPKLLAELEAEIAAEKGSKGKKKSRK